MSRPVTNMELEPSRSMVHRNAGHDGKACAACGRTQPREFSMKTHAKPSWRERKRHSSAHGKDYGQLQAVATCSASPQLTPHNYTAAYTVSPVRSILKHGRAPFVSNQRNITCAALAVKPARTAELTANSPNLTMILFTRACTKLCTMRTPT